MKCRTIMIAIVCLGCFAAIHGFDYASDTAAVRTILDANGLPNIKVTDVSFMLDGRITKLDFQHSMNSSKLTILPSEIGNLDQLTELNVSYNNLTTLPPEIGNLARLTSLSCRYNQLTSLPLAIGNLTELTSLGLGFNQLPSLPPEIGNLLKLTRLNVCTNQLTALPPEIGNLTRLESLQAYSNHLQQLPLELRNLSQLTYLQLNYNSLISLPSGFGNLINLITLNLANNQLISLPDSIVLITPNVWVHGNMLCNVTPAVQAWLNQYSQDRLGWKNGQDCSVHACDSTDSIVVRAILDTNGLSNVRVEDVVSVSNQRVVKLYLGAKDVRLLPAQVGMLSELTELNLWGCNLTQLPPEIGNLTKLTILKAGYNQLTSLPSEIGNLTQLNSIGLPGNKIETLPPEIGNLSRLEWFELTNNDVRALPAEIGGLSSLTNFYLGGNQLSSLPDSIVLLTPQAFIISSNRLCTVLSEPIRAWLNQYDPDWEEFQCMYSVYVADTSSGWVEDSLRYSIAAMDPNTQTSVTVKAPTKVHGYVVIQELLVQDTVGDNEPVRVMDFKLTHDLKDSMVCVILDIYYGDKDYELFDVGSFQIYYRNNESWALVGGIVDTAAKIVTVQVPHLSTYGILGKRKAVDIFGDYTSHGIGTPNTHGIQVSHNAREITFRVRNQNPGDFEMRLYDISGREVWNYQKKNARPGMYFVQPGRGIGNGMYVVRLKQGNRQISKRFTLVR